MKTWVTLNEPSVVSNLGYGKGEHAPGRMGSGFTDYIVGHNLIQAHVQAYRLYKSQYADQGGKA